MLLGVTTCCAFGKNAADVLSAAKSWRFPFCTHFHLDRRNNQIAATSTRTTGMVAANIASRCFEESAEDRTELLVEVTTEDADRVA